MNLSTSVYCPGGTGKKIKHCACRDISSELETIMRAVEGNQRVAALNRINRLLATKAHRPCLLSLKILTLMDTQELQALEETVATFVQVAPENPLAHSFAALLEVRKRNVKAAVDSLQTALYRVTDSFPAELYYAIGVVAQALAADKQYLAARGHAQFRVILGHHEDAVKSLISLTTSPQVPTLLKRELLFTASVGAEPWRRRHETILKDGARGAWKWALQSLEQLNQEYPRQPIILRNIAVARSYLGHPKAPEAWRDHAMSDGLEEEEAVESEATFQLLKFDLFRKRLGLVKLTIDVSDARGAQEKMLSHAQLVNRTGDMTPDLFEGSPPPRAVFELLDRLSPEAGAELNADNVPRILGSVLLFGKETDREARLEMILPKTERFEEVRAIVTGVLHDFLQGSGQREEVVGSVSVDDVELFPRLWFRDETSFTVRRRVNDAATSQAFLEKWPRLPLTALDDKAPADVAGDPAYRTRLRGALLALEQSAHVALWPVDVDQLRGRLGMPVPVSIDPTTCDLRTLEPQVWHRVEAGKLADSQLIEFYRKAVLYGARVVLKKLGEEILRRDSAALREQFDLAEISGGMAELVSDPDTALHYLQRARHFSAKQGVSPARWYLSELPLRLLRGDIAEVEHIIGVLQTRHLQEPGVSQSLTDILVHFGILTPEGEIAGAPSGAAPPAVHSDTVQSAWAPEAPAAGAKKESKLWLPGID